MWMEGMRLRRRRWRRARCNWRRWLGFYGASNCAVVLNTLDWYAWPALSAEITQLGILICAPLLAARYGVWAMVDGALAGTVLQTLMLVRWMERGGYKLRLWWHGASAATREVAGQYGPVLLSSVVASAGLLVDQAMAAMLPAGSVATLAYAHRFAGAFQALAGGTLNAAMTPSFSRLVAYGA